MSNEPQEPLLLDHEYDGIRELDNKLPRWWVWLFYATIIFAVVYLLYYHVYHAGSKLVAKYGQQIAEYKQEMAVGEKLKAAAMSKFESSIPTLQPSKDHAVLEKGRHIFARYCAPCHRADGGGLVGPNLTDNYWIHGSTFSDNVTVIWNGVPAKGMITWKKILKPDQIYDVASFIYTLRGAKLAKPGKPPENQAPAKPAGPSMFE